MFTRHARCPCRCLREDEYTPNSVRSLLTIIHCDNDAAFRDFIINFEKRLVKNNNITTTTTLSGKKLKENYMSSGEYVMVIIF